MLVHSHTFGIGIAAKANDDYTPLFAELGRVSGMTCSIEGVRLTIAWSTCHPLRRCVRTIDPMAVWHSRWFARLRGRLMARLLALSLKAASGVNGTANYDGQIKLLHSVSCIVCHFHLTIREAKCSSQSGGERTVTCAKPRLARSGERRLQAILSQPPRNPVKG